MNSHDFTNGWIHSKNEGLVVKGIALIVLSIGITHSIPLFGLNVI